MGADRHVVWWPARMIWIAIAVYVVFALVFAIGLGRAAALGDRLGGDSLRRPW